MTLAVKRLVFIIATIIVIGVLYLVYLSTRFSNRINYTLNLFLAKNKQ